MADVMAAGILPICKRILRTRLGLFRGHGYFIDVFPRRLAQGQSSTYSRSSARQAMGDSVGNNSQEPCGASLWPRLPGGIGGTLLLESPVS